MSGTGHQVVVRRDGQDLLTTCDEETRRLRMQLSEARMFAQHCYDLIMNPEPGGFEYLALREKWERIPDWVQP